MKKFFLRYSLISLLLVILLGLWDCMPRFSRGENISKDIGFHLPSYSVNEDGGTGHGHRWLTITLDTPLPEHIIENIKNEKNGWEKSGENKFKTHIHGIRSCNKKFDREISHQSVTNRKSYIFFCEKHDHSNHKERYHPYNLDISLHISSRTRRNSSRICSCVPVNASGSSKPM